MLTDKRKVLNQMAVCYFWLSHYLFATRFVVLSQLHLETVSGAVIGKPLKHKIAVFFSMFAV